MRRVRSAGAGVVAPLVAGLVLLVAATTTPAATAASPPTAAPSDAQGVVYPLTSFLDWAQNPAHDFTDQSLGEYALEQEIDQAQSAVLTQDPQALADALSGPNAVVDAEAFSEQMAAELTHLRPVVAGDDVTDMANPDFMPDFDHNGVYGDPGDFTAMEQGHATGAFLYPCIDDAGDVTYETAAGTCAAAGTPGDTFLSGEAEQQTIIDSRGSRWPPPSGCPRRRSSTAGRRTASRPSSFPTASPRTKATTSGSPCRSRRRATSC